MCLSPHSFRLYCVKKVQWSIQSEIICTNKAIEISIDNDTIMVWCCVCTLFCLGFHCCDWFRRFWISFFSSNFMIIMKWQKTVSHSLFPRFDSVCWYCRMWDFVSVNNKKQWEKRLHAWNVRDVITHSKVILELFRRPKENKTEIKWWINKKTTHTHTYSENIDVNYETSRKTENCERGWTTKKNLNLQLKIGW